MQNQNKFHYKAMMFLSFAGPAVILFSAVVIEMCIRDRDKVIQEKQAQLDAFIAAK